MTTITYSSASASVPHWRKLYLAALFETDELKLPVRIAEAERALVLRIRELFRASGHNTDELKAVDKGLYAIHALSNCVRLKQTKGKAT